MNRFLHPTRLALTPLTPIHIGCGEDFEPTNYVIDDGVLFHFDPARVPLADRDRNALASAVDKRGDEAIRELQRFFHTRKDAYAAAAHCVVGVAPGVAEQYAKRIGSVAQHESGGRRVANQLEIERCAHHPHDGTPYIPGSSLKGAIRTAWLDQLNRGLAKLPDERNAQDIEKRLLNSRAGFHADPFRLVRIGDAAGPALQSRVVFSTNHKKRLVHDRDGRVVRAKGLATRREVIEPGQFRALSTELSLHGLPGMRANDRIPGEADRITDFRALALACNGYYLKRLDALLELLDTRRFAAPAWIERTRKLVSHLRPRLQAGELMLLRVGRHSGAESVTLDGVRSIRIMTGRNQAPEWSPEGAKTVWLTAEREDDHSGMLPFGWLLLEPADTPPDPVVEGWCAAQPRTDLATIHARLAEARHRATEEAERLHRMVAERQAHALAEAARRAEREAALASMSAEGKLIAEFVEACEARQQSNRKDPCNPGAGLYGRASALAKAALADDGGWSAGDRVALAQALSEWLPRVVDKLDRKDDWKDARKKLKLALLHGESSR